MSRQRTINDQRFWRSPRLQSCTTEDKIALLHLLTCPDSNIVGTYPLVPRIAGAEIGWTPDQWLQIIDRLRCNDLIWFDPERMFVWVRIWWEHHHAGQSMGPKLRNRTLDDIRNIPKPWLEPFLEDFRPRLAPAQQFGLDSIWDKKTASDTQSERYGYDIDTISTFSLSNANINSNKITLTPVAPPSLSVDISSIPALHRSTVLEVLQQGISNGTATVEAQAVVDVLARQFKSATNQPRSPAALTHYLLNHLGAKAGPQDLISLTSQEREALSGRCFAWPPDHANSYVRIGHCGEFELFNREDGKLVRRVGKLDHSDLLEAIRQSRAREVSTSAIEDINREAYS